MMTTLDDVQLSVIIASYNSRSTIERCLESLRGQKTHASFETIVVDSSTDETASIVEEMFPEVALYKFSERKYCGDARNLAISVAKGEIIAFIDADCVVNPGWVDEVLKAHQSADLAIGGAIANVEPSNLAGWAGYFCEFSQWMPKTPETFLDDVAGASMSYKRRVFEEHGGFIGGTYCSDTHFHWRLAGNGHRIRFVPSILVYHHSIDDFRRLMRHEYHHGRSFARVRILGRRFTRLRRSIHVAFCFLIPVKLFVEIGMRNLRNRVYASAFLKSVPFLVPCLASWSVGECAGYIEGNTYEKSG